MSAPVTELPSGLVTFVLTDIEGSTRLFHRLGDRYVGVLDRHRMLIAEACRTRGGHVVSELGDSCFLAFDSADSALAACADAQRSIAEAAWPESVRVRVRMGVHTGMAWPHEGNYVALSVHQAARVMAAAHGGQTLVSESAVGELPEDGRSALEPLGRYRLRDFDDPVTVYQLGPEEPETSFPAPRALPADRHNIVRRPTETIGREPEIAELADLVEPGVVITITGPGGVGKTRVAAEVGTRIASEWPDGVWMVDLASIVDEGVVVSAVAEAVGAPRQPGMDRWSDLATHLEARSAVLILDNCEHLLGACRRLIEGLGSRYPTIGILCTSREPIRVAGELLRPVTPLAVSSEPSFDVGAASPAVELFVDRAEAVRPGFSLDESTAPAVSGICRRLDGIPLFIELAAANVAVLGVSDILSGLEESIGFLESRDPSVPDRHRTLEGVLRWSHELLDDQERAALRRLAPFASSFTLDAAVSAISEGADGDPRVVWSLADRSLLVVDLGANDTRYRLLETVRSFARARLDESGETPSVAVRLSEHFLDRLGPWVPAGIEWVGAVAVDLDNLRALIPLIPRQREELAQQLAYTIGRYHDATYGFREGIDELTRLTDALREGTPARSSLLAMLADLHLRTGDAESAARLVDEAERARTAHGAPAWDDVGVDRTRGEVARRTGDLDAASRIARETLDRGLTDRGRSRMLNLLGTTSAAIGDMDAAYEALSAELELNRALGYDEYVASGEGNLAEVSMRRGDLESAAKHQRACLELAGAHGSQPMLAFSMITAARLAAAEGQWETAVRLQARAEVILAEIGLVLYDDDRAELDEVARSAAGALGEDTIADIAAGAVEMPLPDAVRLADEVLSTTAGESLR